MRLVGDAQRADRPDHHLVAHVLELGCGEERGAAELGHVGEQRKQGTRAATARNIRRWPAPRGRSRRRRPPEQFRACHRAVHALARGGVGAGDDEQMPAGPSGGGNLGSHVMGVGQFLVVQVAAFLRQQLVLDVHRGGAGILERTHHVHDVQRLAVSGVAVDQQRQAGGAGDLADEEAHLVDGDHAEVGHAHRGGHRRAGQIERVEPRRLCLQRSLAVVRARHLQDARPGQQGTEALAGRGGGQIGGDEIGHGQAPKLGASRHS